MKYIMKCLKHNGIYVPPYDYKELSIEAQGSLIKLSPKTEQMALAWVRKEMSMLSPPDKVFKNNFMGFFLAQLRKENSSLQLPENVEVDFSKVRKYVERVQAKKLNMTKGEKKQLAFERKQKREKLKEHYGYAEVDGKRIEIANWTAEPSCLFAGRGDHPRRGSWKDGPTEEDITLNLSPDAPRPSGKWKDITWENSRMYIAKWVDKLCGKMKYVWFSDATFVKQNKEKEKFTKAHELDKYISSV
jgi:DNA topoisomerase-1